MSKINICICTYKRPKLLANCLESLGDIVVPSGTEVTVTVIDNDQTRSAEATVTALIGTLPFNIYYHCESKRGIPCARNRAVDETHRLGSDYLVFIDDDEWVESLWLDLLYAYCQTQGGNVVVSGAVISDLPDETPEYLCRFFERPRRVTGDQLDHCATNNVLIPIAVTKIPDLRFDESKPLAGGTDIQYFHAAAKVGVVIMRCGEALVHESVPGHRASMRWLSKRKFRGGITVAELEKQGGRSSLNIITSSSSKLVTELFIAATMLLLGEKHKRSRHWLKACRSLGKLSGVFGLTVDSYKNIDGE